LCLSLRESVGGRADGVVKWSNIADVPARV
jgi:hypothetical protein